MLNPAQALPSPLESHWSPHSTAAGGVPESPAQRDHAHGLGGVGATSAVSEMIGRLTNPAANPGLPQIQDPQAAPASRAVAAADEVQRLRKLSWSVHCGDNLCACARNQAAKVIWDLSLAMEQRAGRPALSATEIASAFYLEQSAGTGPAGLFHAGIALAERHHGVARSFAPADQPAAQILTHGAPSHCDAKVYAL